MPRKKNMPEILIDETTEDVNIDALFAEDSEDENTNNPPKLTFKDKDWTAIVLSHLTDDEVFKGSPTVDGLRRVTELLLGAVKESHTIIPQAPNIHNGNIAVAIHTISIDTFDNGVIIFSGAADSTSGGNFADNYPTAIAETRAEARAYRKALRLRKIICAEETNGTIAEINTESGCNENQKTVIKILLHRTGIDIEKLSAELQMLPINENTLNTLNYDNAVKLIECLSKYQTNKDTIPSHILKGNL